MTLAVTERHRQASGKGATYLKKEQRGAGRVVGRGKRRDRYCHPWLLDDVLRFVGCIPRRHDPDFPVIGTIDTIDRSPFPLMPAVMVSVGGMLPLLAMMMAVIMLPYMAPMIVSKCSCGREYYGKRVQ